MTKKKRPNNLKYTFEGKSLVEIFGQENYPKAFYWFKRGLSVDEIWEKIKKKRHSYKIEGDSAHSFFRNDKKAYSKYCYYRGKLKLPVEKAIALAKRKKERLKIDGKLVTEVYPDKTDYCCFLNWYYKTNDIKKAVKLTERTKKRRLKKRKEKEDKEKIIFSC